MHYITEEEFVRLIHGGVIKFPFGERGACLDVALDFDLRQAVDLVETTMKAENAGDAYLDSR